MKILSSRVAFLLASNRQARYRDADDQARWECMMQSNVWDAILGAFPRRALPHKLGGKISASFVSSGETIDSPTKVTIAYPYAENYQFDNVARVVVFGGKRWVPAWNIYATAYDNPTGVMVTMVDGKERQFKKAGKFGNLFSVYVTGGTRLFDVSISGEDASSCSDVLGDDVLSYVDDAEADAEALRKLVG